MELNINVDAESRGLTFTGAKFGTVDENEINTLKFEIPDELAGFGKRVIFENKFGNFGYNFDNTFTIPREVLQDEKVKFQLKLTGGGAVWRSKIYYLNVYQSLNESDTNIIEEAEQRGATTQQEADRLEIAESLTICDEANGFTDIPDYAAMDWQNLRNQIEVTQLLNDDMRDDLQAYAAVKTAIAQTENKNPVEMITVWKAIEQEAALATNHVPLLSRRMGTQDNPFSFLYSVPYLKTENVVSLTQNAAQTLNTNCVSCGIDCSSMNGTGLTTGTVSFFSGVNVPGSRNLQSVKITNMQTITTCHNLFYNCPGLQTVDLDGLQATTLTQMFALCSNLKNVILRNSVIKDSIDFSASPYLTKASVISILSAAGANGSGKRITFNTAVRFLGDLTAEIDAATAKGWEIVGF